MKDFALSTAESCKGTGVAAGVLLASAAGCRYRELEIRQFGAPPGAIIGNMRHLAFMLALCASLLYSQQIIPTIEGETLDGSKVSLPRAAGGHSTLLIIGFTYGSRNQAKAWVLRVGDRFPAWSIVVLEDVPRLVRGMVIRSIKSGTPKEQYRRFVLVYHGENVLKRVAGFDRPDDAYLLVIDGTGSIRWTFHGPVTDTALEQIGHQFNR